MRMYLPRVLIPSREMQPPYGHDIIDSIRHMNYGDGRAKDEQRDCRLDISYKEEDLC